MRKFAENFCDEEDKIVVADDLRIRGSSNTTAEVKRLKTMTTKKTTKKKVSVSVSPYNVYELRIRRLRSNSALHRNETTTFQDDDTVVVSTSCVDDNNDEVVAVNFSSNFVSSSSSSSSCSSEFLKNCDNSTTNTTPEIVADLEVDSVAEMSSKFVDCNKSARKIDETSKIDHELETNRLDHLTKNSTVEIKSTTTIPSESEIEDFFSSAEKDLQKRFSDKYNYDIVKDIPLEGRYEWLEITP